MMNMKTNEQLRAELYAPLPAEAIKPHPTKSYLSTIKPIYITDRLNEVFGIGKWQTKTENVLIKDNGTIVNKTTFIVPDYNIYYECFGGNDNGGADSKGFDLGDAFKGATTDALNKIASYLGVGIDVYRGKQSHAPKPQSNYQQPAPTPVSKPALQPNASFDTKPAKKELPKDPKVSEVIDYAVSNSSHTAIYVSDDDRKTKALLALEKTGKLHDVKQLIKLQKDFKKTEEGKAFVNGASLADVVKLNPIEMLLEFHKFLK